MNFVRLLALPLLVSGFASAQTVTITGRILERAAMDPVPGATVRLKGYNLTATTDTAGRFTISGVPTALRPQTVQWSGPLMDREGLHFRTLTSNVRVVTNFYDSQGKNIATASYNLESSGLHVLPVLQHTPSDFIGFLTVQAGEENYRLKVFHSGGPVAVTEARFVTAPSALAKASAVGDSVQASITGLLTKTVSAPNNGDLGDIIMDYPTRPMIGVGLAPPYGAKMLFDGSRGGAYATANYFPLWHEWWRFNATAQAPKPAQPISFKIAKDPEFPTDTNHVSLRMCCETASGRWGYSDIQENEKHGDAQMHVEWIQMGKWDSTQSENPDSTTQCTATSATSSACWNNSGVYVQSRLEIQIQSNALAPTSITDTHYMGTIVNEHAPLSNQNKKNGIWQSYDITFRTARWRSTTTNRANAGDTAARLSVWWNGVQVHLNWPATGAAAGISNHSGENMNDTLYGLKLQDEIGDVRFRNVWIKKLKIDSTGTNLFY